MREAGIALAMVEQSTDRMKSRYFDTTPPAAASYERLTITECIGPLKFYWLLIFISAIAFGVGFLLSPRTRPRMRMMSIRDRWRRMTRTSKVGPQQAHNNLLNVTRPAQTTTTKPRFWHVQHRLRTTHRKTSVWHQKITTSVAPIKRHVINVPMRNLAIN